MIESSAGAFWVMTAVVAVVMGLVSMVSVQLIVYVQIVADKLLLGRIMSFIVIVSTLAVPLGQVMYGGLSTGLSQSFLTILILVIALFTVLISMFSIRIFRGMKEVKE